MDGEDVTQEIRSPEITRNCSKYVANLKDVRKIMVSRQREMGRRGGLVVEGRDTTTVVFPRADLRIFLDAPFDDRVARRVREIKMTDPASQEEVVREDLERRDREDIRRPFGPLKLGRGVVLIDTAGLTPEEVANRIVLETDRLAASRYSLLYSIAHAFIWIVSKLLFRMKVSGSDHVPRNGGIIIASNHASYLDPPIVGTAITSRQICYLARETLFKNPIFGWLIRDFHSIPIRRGSADTDAFESVLSVLRGGGCVVMFPEGTRTLNGELQPAKRGVGYLAVLSGVPVVPAYVSGTYRVMPKGRVIPSPASIQVYFGAPIDIGPYLKKPKEKETFQELSDTIMERIKVLKDAADR
jgi:1-acyl-sn-glycerol-3-phosphate acyltransferase